MAITSLVPQSNLTIKRPQTVSYVSNGFTTDINNVVFPLQNGVPIQTNYTFKIVPASVSDTCVAPLYTFPVTWPGGIQPVPLSTVRSGTSASPGVQSDIRSVPFFYKGTLGVLLDCERSIQVIFSSTTTTQTNIIVTGYDYRGVLTVQNELVFPGSTLIYFIKTMAFIKSVTFSANPGVSFSIGTNGIIGLPYFLPTTSFILGTPMWNGATLASNSGSVVAGFDWRPNTPVTESAARGYVILNNLTTPVNPPDGTRMFVMQYYVYGADSEVQNELENYNQSTMNIVNVQPTASYTTTHPSYAYPYLTEYDLIGVQFGEGPSLPGGDSVFYDQTTNANGKEIGIYQRTLAS